MTCIYDNDADNGTYYDTATGFPCSPSGGIPTGGSSGGGQPTYNPSTGRIDYPNITVTAGGVTAPTGNINTILSSILSGVALVQHAPYVPTTIQPQQQPIVYNPNLAAGSNLNLNSNQGIATKIQNWISKNQGVAAMLAVGAFIYLRPPQVKRNGLKRRTGRRR